MNVNNSNVWFSKLSSSFCNLVSISVFIHICSLDILLVAGLSSNHVGSGIRLRGGGSVSNLTGTTNGPVQLLRLASKPKLNPISEETLIIPLYKGLYLPVLSHRQLESSSDHDGRIGIQSNLVSENSPNGLLVTTIGNEKSEFKQLDSFWSEKDPLTNIPDRFRQQDTPYILSYQTDQRRNPFPRWGNYDYQVRTAGSNEFYRSIENSKTEDKSIIVTMIDFIHESGMAYEKFYKHHDEGDKMDIHVVHTSEHLMDACGWLPEVLYILRGTSELTSRNDANERENVVLKSDDVGHGLYVSDTAFYTTATYYPSLFYKKLTTTHDMVVRAYNTFRNLVSTENNQMTNSTSFLPSDVITRWPRLYQILHIEQGSIPFIMWHGDYTGCNYHNWPSKKASIPLFTVAANIECHYTIPFPNYQTYDDSHETTVEWIDDFITNKLEWKNKIQKVVWRGGLTGRMPVSTNEADRGPRYHLLKHVHTIATLEQREMFDVKLVYLTDNPDFNELLMQKNTTSNDISSDETRGSTTKTEFLGEVGGPWMPMHEFNNYRAIIDVDGNSWSSRFGKLLCFNSVILKIEPQYVDYFYYKQGESDNLGSSEDKDSANTRLPILMPWKHYIPIRYDMSDLFEKTQYALDSSNEIHITKIIRNANEWCHKNMIRESIVYDVLDIWEAYVENVLENSERAADSNSPREWQKQWKEYMPTVMNGPMHMQQTEHYD